MNINMLLLVNCTGNAFMYAKACWEMCLMPIGDWRLSGKRQKTKNITQTPCFGNAYRVVETFWETPKKVDLIGAFLTESPDVAS